MSTIKKNIGYQTLAQVGGRGLMFFVYMLLARILGPALYGTFGYTLSTVQIVSGIFFDLGLFLIVTRELSTGNDSIFVPALWLKVCGCFAGSIILFALTLILDFPMALVTALVGWAIANSFTDFYFCVFRAKNRMYGETITMIVQRLFLLGILLMVFIGYIHVPEPSILNASGAAFFGSAFFGFVMVFLLTLYYFPSLIEYSGLVKIIQEVKALSKQALPLIGVSIFGFIYYKIDIVLLGILSTHEEVGFYSAPYRIIEASFLIPMIMMNALYPRLSILWAQDVEGFFQIFKKTVLTSIGVASVMSLGVIILAEPVIRILFGSAFSPSAGILCLLSAALIMVYPGYVMTQSLVILGKQKSYLYVSIIAAFTNIVLNCIFIPLWQAKGAAIATIFTEAMVTCVALVLIMRHVSYRRQL